ncbi:MFS transporter [Ktedonosporobacter rubrisoli]|uniref:MFS transporter n=1 Tax=Ktedonosporobacter rubrisoli TaxID=2509675 RepID=A0A4P6JHW9_KTERU|nr:MFS transporter [Ktedonosporobacter rubrisoli]QBD74502.1 MFS transporter [Ktedonosporobacter rubrisoli]
MKLPAYKQLLSPLKYRDFRLLWIGQAISAFGNPFQTVALSWLILQVTGSAVDLAICLLFLSIPMAASTLVGGVLTDRFDARVVMLWSDAIRVVTSGAIAVLAFTGWMPLWLLCAILLVHGTANGIFNPAANSIAPRVVPVEVLDGANSLASSVAQFGTLLGAVPAGFLVAAGQAGLAFLLNALSFAVAVWTTLQMKPLPLSPQTDTKKLTLLQQALQGFSYLGGMPWLVALIIMDMLAGLAAIGPLTVGLPLLSQQIFHTGAQGYGLLVWSFGCGTVVGMFLPSIIHPTRRRGLLMIGLQAVQFLLLIGIVFAPFPLALVLVFTHALTNGMISILFLSLIQAKVASNMLGRIMSFSFLASYGIVPLSQTATGIIAQQVGLYTLFLLASGIMLLGALWGLLVPAFRTLE